MRIEGVSFARFRLMPVLFPLVGAAFTCSNYLTIALALERYLATCRGHSTSRVARGWMLAFAAIAWGVLFNVPKFFEFSYLDMGGGYGTIAPSNLRCFDAISIESYSCSEKSTVVSTCAQSC